VHADPRHSAKTLALHARGGWRIAVLPPVGPMLPLPEVVDVRLL